MLETMGWISIVPVALAVILAFATRNTIASLATACILQERGYWVLLIF